MDISTEKTCEHLVKEEGSDEYFDTLAFKAEELLKDLKLPERWREILGAEQTKVEELFLGKLRDEGFKEVREIKGKAVLGRQLLRQNPDLASDVFKEMFSVQTQAAKPVSKDKPRKPLGFVSHTIRANENINLNSDDSTGNL